MKNFTLSIALLVISLTSNAQWTEVFSPPNGQRLLSTSFINSSTGYVLCANQQYQNEYFSLYATSNSGTNWSLVNSYTTTGGNYQYYHSQIYFYNNTLGVSRSYDALYRTLDGGLNWNQFTVPGYLTKYEHGNIFVDSDYNSKIDLISTNAGFSFFAVPELYSYEFEILNNGIGAYVNGSTYYTTTNYGINWDLVGGINTILGQAINNFSIINLNTTYFLEKNYSGFSNIIGTQNRGNSYSSYTISGNYIDNFEALSDNKLYFELYNLINNTFESMFSNDGGNTFNALNLASNVILTTTGTNPSLKENFFNGTIGYGIGMNILSGNFSIYRYSESFIPSPTTTTGGNSSYQFVSQNALSTCNNSDFTVALNVSSVTSSIIGLDFEIPFDATKFYVKSVTSGNLLIQTNSIDINTIAGSPAKLMIGVSTTSLSGSGSMLIANAGTVLNIVFGTYSALPASNYSFGTAHVIESFNTTNTGMTFAGIIATVTSGGSNLLTGNVYVGNSSSSLSNAGIAKITISEMVNCNTILGNSILSTSNSTISFTPNSSTNSLKFSRNVSSSSGVSTFINSTDAIAVSRIRQGISPYQWPTLHQLLAADVNSDGAVTSGDKTQILRRSVLNLTSFSQIPGASDWKFYKKGTLYAFSKDNVPVLSNCVNFTSTGSSCLTYENLSIVGIPTGDVNENYLMSANGLNFRQESTDFLSFDLSGQLNNGLQVVPVYITNSNSDLGFDFTLDYIESANLSIKTVTLNNVVVDDASYNVLNNDKLLFSVVLNQVPSIQTPIMWIEFETTTALQSSDFDLNMSSAMSNDRTIGMRTDGTTGVSTSSENEIKLSVYPNPTENGSFTIQSNAINWTYSISDVIGKEIISGKSVSKNVDIDGLKSGIYFVRINNTLLKKVVVY